MGKIISAYSTVADKSGSSGMVSFPDVCKVPAPPAPFVPVPYPNSQYQQNLKAANRADARAKAGSKAAQKDVEAAVSSATLASYGDEAGTLKGIVSSKQMGKVSYERGSSKVTIEGKGTVNITTATQAVIAGYTLHQKYNNGK